MSDCADIMLPGREGNNIKLQPEEIKGGGKSSSCVIKPLIYVLTKPAIGV